MTGFSDASERFGSLGLGSIQGPVRRHGFLGAGAGKGSQEAQHFGGGATLIGYSAEGGLGKIVVQFPCSVYRFPR